MALLSLPITVGPLLLMTGYGSRVRLTDFRELVHGEFGVARGDALLADHVLPPFGRTGAQAIEDGADPREVWRAICADFDVPRARW